MALPAGSANPMSLTIYDHGQKYPLRDVRLTIIDKSTKDYQFVQCQVGDVPPQTDMAGYATPHDCTVSHFDFKATTHLDITIDSDSGKVYEDFFLVPNAHGLDAEEDVYTIDEKFRKKILFHHGVNDGLFDPSLPHK